MLAKYQASALCRHVEPNHKLLSLLRDQNQRDTIVQSLKHAVHSAMCDEGCRMLKHVELRHGRPNDEVRGDLPKRLNIGLFAHREDELQRHVSERLETLPKEVRAAEMEGSE